MAEADVTAAHQSDSQRHAHSIGALICSDASNRGALVRNIHGFDALLVLTGSTAWAILLALADPRGQWGATRSPCRIISVAIARAITIGWPAAPNVRPAQLRPGPAR